MSSTVYFLGARYYWEVKLRPSLVEVSRLRMSTFLLEQSRVLQIAFMTQSGALYLIMLALSGQYKQQTFKKDLQTSEMSYFYQFFGIYKEVYNTKLYFLNIFHPKYSTEKKKKTKKHHFFSSHKTSLKNEYICQQNARCFSEGKNSNFLCYTILAECACQQTNIIRDN